MDTFQLKYFWHGTTSNNLNRKYGVFTYNITEAIF